MRNNTGLMFIQLKARDKVSNQFVLGKAYTYLRFATTLQRISEARVCFASFSHVLEWSTFPEPTSVNLCVFRVELCKTRDHKGDPVLSSKILNSYPADRNLRRLERALGHMYELLFYRVLLYSENTENWQRPTLPFEILPPPPKKHYLWC